MITRVRVFIVVALSGIICTSCLAGNGNGMERGTTSVFIATDLHNQDKMLMSLLGNVLNDADAVAPSVVLLGGDYVGGQSGRGSQSGHPAMSDSVRHHSSHDGMEKHSMHDSGRHHPSSSHNSNTAFNVCNIKHEIDSVTAVHQHTSLLTYGSHDIAAREGYDAFFSGPYTADGYYLYGISYAQMIYDTPDTTYNGIDKVDARGCCATTATENFDKWVTSLTDSKPIIIMSHVPIHALRNDNQGGERWYQSITKAAGKHDILFLYGHNHTVEDGGKVSDRKNYLLIPGDTIVTQGTVVKGNAHDSRSSKTYPHALNFYYGNAGYIKNGYGTLITFKWDGDNHQTMTLKRYSVDGNTPATIGDTDKKNPYTIKLRGK